MNRIWINMPLAWVTRIVSILYVAMNAWGWWDESQARIAIVASGGEGGDIFWQWAVLTHLLPTVLILVASLFGWARPMFGVIGFGIFTALGVLSVGTEWKYLPFVAGPPLGMALLYLAGWVLAKKSR